MDSVGLFTDMDQRRRRRRSRLRRWRHSDVSSPTIYTMRTSRSPLLSTYDGVDGIVNINANVNVNANVNANCRTTLHCHDPLWSQDFECFHRLNAFERPAVDCNSGTTSDNATTTTTTTTTIFLRRFVKFVWINVLKLTLNMCRRTLRSIFGAFLQFGRRRKCGFRFLTTSLSFHNMFYAPVTTLIIFASTVLRLADACSSRSTPKPRTPSPTIRPNITFPTSVCPPNYDTWYCLNGATCFTVEISESVLYNCVCADGYTGPRCEFKDLDGSYLPSRDRIMVERASIAGGVTVAVLLIVIISIAFYIYSRRRKKERTLSNETVTDGIGVLRPRHFRSYRLSKQEGHNIGNVRQCRSIYHQDVESGMGNLRRPDPQEEPVTTSISTTGLSTPPNHRSSGSPP